MKSIVQFKIGSNTVTFPKPPIGMQGACEVLINDQKMLIEYEKSEFGISIRNANRLLKFDIYRELTDEGYHRYSLYERQSEDANAVRVWEDVSLFKGGESEVLQSKELGLVKRQIKVKAQMPGKIIKILVQPGDKISKDQSLIVMEAMKMENEIKAIHAGIVKKILVDPNQAVETGIDLMVLENE